MANVVVKKPVKALSSTPIEPSTTSNMDEWQIIQCKYLEDIPGAGVSTETLPQNMRLVILHGKDLFWATAPSCALQDWRIIWPAIRLDCRPLPVENIWPSPARCGTLAPNPIPSFVIVQWPKLLDFKDGYQSQRDQNSPRLMLDREFHMAEDSRRAPHPNVVAYHGCIKHGNLVTGLCYTRCDQSLEDRLASYHERPFDIEKCLDGISRGISHVHAMGYAHNLLIEGNIKMDSDDTPVIANFEGCAMEGERMFKYPVRSQRGESFNTCTSSRVNDFSCLSRIRESMAKISGESRK